MGSLSLWHWLVVVLVIMLLFGKGRISEMMGDLAKGIKSFKKGMADDDVQATGMPTPTQVLQQPAPQPTATPDSTPR